MEDIKKEEFLLFWRSEYIHTDDEYGDEDDGQGDGNSADMYWVLC